MKNKRRIIYFILVVIWMISIFCFSHQNGIKSRHTSDIITNKIAQGVVEDKDTIEEAKFNISFIIRKSAHFIAYFVGGILIFEFINTFSIKIKYTILLTIIFGLLYAISDEVHQLFIDGRAAQIRDVVIDCSRSYDCNMPAIF